MPLQSCQINNQKGFKNGEEGKLKWNKLKRLNIDVHYDNNENEIKKIMN